MTPTAELSTLELCVSCFVHATLGCIAIATALALIAYYTYTKRLETTNDPLNPSPAPIQ